MAFPSPLREKRKADLIIRTYCKQATPGPDRPYVSNALALKQASLQQGSTLRAGEFDAPHITGTSHVMNGNLVGVASRARKDMSFPVDGVVTPGKPFAPAAARPRQAR